jgi:hypothetical protein
MHSNRPNKHHAAQYTSQRGLATICNTAPQTIARHAAALRVGTPGKYANSPRIFTEDEGARVAESVFQEQAGKLRVQIMAAKAETVRYARLMAGLSSLAEGMGHPAAAELRELGRIVAQIDSTPDLKTTEGRARFLNSVKPHYAKLTAAMDAVQSKI